ncbi:MAG: tRNA uridine(34) 5-carboxymethylaminomethyl modification radical SAM/GNAT enzyme Elp3 [Nitrososphaerales archaeon]
MQSHTDAYLAACSEIAIAISNMREPDMRSVKRVIKQVSAKYALPSLPKNSDILSHANLSSYSIIRKLLLVKPTKTASGVAVVTVMPKPYACPHGRCTFCPGGVEVNTPNSYTGSEPSTQNAITHAYDPYKQIRSKIQHLQRNGHDISKVEVVVVGGTFLFMPHDYQHEFIKACYDALNGSLSSTLEEAKTLNERASIRNVGLTIETKPDYCKHEHIDLMLEYGATRVEIGVQALRDEVYRITNRGHTLDDVIESFQIARDAGYKIVAHMMPGLPNSSTKQDIDDFKRLFTDPLFKPDMLKVYPTLVVENTGLFAMYKQGSYKVYTDEDLINVIVEVKKMIPRWVRIMRVQREIASKDIVDGPKSGNLRQTVLERLRTQGLKCNCIRCREVGLQRNHQEYDVELLVDQYMASDGNELFLSYEDPSKNVLFGFLRMRYPSNRAHRPEVKDCCIVRELHVYGQALRLGVRDHVSWQHRGYGAMLMHEAERIALEEFDSKKMLVISAVGTREYYRKLGYSREGPYMSKRLL